MAEAVLGTHDDWQIGKTKIFLKVRKAPSRLPWGLWTPVLVGTGTWGLFGEAGIRWAQGWACASSHPAICDRTSGEWAGNEVFLGREGNWY